jgi:hypothetical protein
MGPKKMSWFRELRSRVKMLRYVRLRRHAHRYPFINVSASINRGRYTT